VTEEESVLRRSLEAWNENDWDALEALWNPDGEIDAPEGWPESGTQVGWDAVRTQFERIKDSWAEESVELIRVERTGDRLLGHLRWVLRGEASGAPLEVPMWMLCEFRDARFSRIRYFMDEGAALDAAKEAAG
jgi:ketosteroid isomerase-like protein